MTMRLSHALAQGPFRTASSSSSAPFSRHNFNLSPNVKRVFEFGNHSFRFLNCSGSTSGSAAVSSAANSSSSVIASNSGISRKKPGKLEAIEEDIEKVLVSGYSGSFWFFNRIVSMFYQGTFVAETFMVYFTDRSKVILMLVEAIDVYLLGTIMLVFGMGLYEIFVGNLVSAGSLPDQHDSYRSNLFGLFTLKERPKWLGIKTVNDLKTKLGHVIVMLLLIGLFDKSKKAVIHSCGSSLLLCFRLAFL